MQLGQLIGQYIVKNIHRHIDWVRQLAKFVIKSLLERQEFGYESHIWR